MGDCDGPCFDLKKKKKLKKILLTLLMNMQMHAPTSNRREIRKKNINPIRSSSSIKNYFKFENFSARNHNSINAKCSLFEKKKFGKF